MSNRIPPKHIDELLAHFQKTQNMQADLSPIVRRKVQANDEWKIERAVYVWWLANCAGFGVHPKLYFSVPNGSALGFGKEEFQKKGSAIRGRLLKLIGLQTGVPDKMLAVPRNGFPGLFIEYKTPKGVISDEQTEMHHILRGAGYSCHVCWSAEEGIGAIKYYLT